MAALTQAVARAQRAADARTAELGLAAWNSSGAGFSFANGRICAISKRQAGSSDGTVIPLADLVRFQRYRLVELAVSFNVGTPVARTKGSVVPKAFRLASGRSAGKQATIRIAAGPQLSAQFVVDGVKYGDFTMNS